jgi:hypothetical protein
MSLCCDRVSQHNTFITSKINHRVALEESGIELEEAEIEEEEE